MSTRNKNFIEYTQPEEADKFTDEIDAWLSQHSQELEICMFCNKKLKTKEEMVAGFCYKCM